MADCQFAGPLSYLRTCSLEPGCPQKWKPPNLDVVCESTRQTLTRHRETSHHAMFRDVPPLLLYCETLRDTTETIPLSDPGDIYETFSFLSLRAALDSAALL